MAQEPADTLPLSLAEPPLSDDLQPSSAVSSPTQPGPVLYMPSAAGDSVPVSPSSPHAPDLSAVRVCPGAGWAPCPPRSQHLPLTSPTPILCLGRRPWYLALEKALVLPFQPQGSSLCQKLVAGGGWCPYSLCWSVWGELVEGTKPSVTTHTHTSFTRFWVPWVGFAAHWQMKMELGPC